MLCGDLPSPEALPRSAVLDPHVLAEHAMNHPYQAEDEHHPSPQVSECGTGPGCENSVQSEDMIAVDTSVSVTPPLDSNPPLGGPGGLSEILVSPVSERAERSQAPCEEAGMTTSFSKPNDLDRFMTRPSLR